jgi:hypothetical protein
LSLFTNEHHYGIGRFSLNESTETIKTFDSTLLGNCKVVKEDDKIVLYDEQGYIHSEIYDDWTKLDGPFALLPIGGLMVDAKNVLLIGLGLGNVYRFFKNALPNTKVTCIEYDANTANITSEVMDIPQEDIIIGDGAEVVKTLSGTYDQIILDAYDDFSIPEVFSTDEFWDTIKTLLSEDAVITVNYCSPNDEGVEENFIKIHDNIKRILNKFDIIPMIIEGYEQNIYNYFVKVPHTEGLKKYIQAEYNPFELSKNIAEIKYLPC